MLEYSIYSVISPEGCATILWKNSDKAEIAAKSMGITADRLQALDLVDEVLKEPLGGAHRAPEFMAETVQNAIVANLRQLQALPLDELLARREQRLASVGRYRES
jgi:acetyl-CoA carboxylase carboxyl transferase subunit alpha